MKQGHCLFKNKPGCVTGDAVGSLIPLKQFDVFVEIVTEIKKEYPGINAMLIGDGPQKGRLENRIKELNAEENITLTGELSHNEVLIRMQRAKILLHPSSYEGFSGVCLEALSRGAQVISFCRAMKRDFTQWHIVHTKDEMKQKAIALLKNHAAINSTISFPSMEDTARQMMKLFLDKA